MHVLVIFTYGYSLKTWKESGTLDKELSLYVELSEKYNLKFTFLSYGKKEDIQLIKNYKNFSVIPIYEIIKQSNNRFIRYIKSFLIPFKVSKLIKEDIDLIKHNQLNGSWVAIILKTLITKKVYIRTGYDMYLFSKHDKKSKLIQYLYKVLTKFTLKFCDFYTVSSKADYEFLTQNFKNTEKIKIRPNSIKLCSNTEEPRRFSDKILCVGRLESQKNFSFIIKEFEKTNIQIDFVGDGSEKNSLLKLAKKHQVKINFLGTFDNKELLSLFSKYKYFVNPSLYEGNPKTVIEAMSKGCIVFVSNIKNHNELVTHKQDGFVFELEKHSLKNLFEKHFDENTDLISRNAIDKIKSLYDIEIAAKNEFYDYEDMIKL